MSFSRNIDFIREQTFLLFVLSFLILLPLFYYLSKNLPETSISIEIHQVNRNQNGTIRRVKEPIIFSKSKYLKQTRKPSENVICFLVASYAGEPRSAVNPYPRLHEKILQLDERFGDGHITDVIIFHTGYPFREDILSIIEGSHRQVEFVNIDHLFNIFPPDFHPHIRDPSWSQRGKWNYHHMCYFWFKQVFEMKIIQRYRYIMRLDDDSQMKGKWPNVFEIMNQQQAVYLANQREVDYEYILRGITKIRNLVIEHIRKNNIIVQNPDMFADIFNKTIEIPNYWNNVEVVDLSFMQRKDVLDFTKAVDDSHGIFLYRWGDAPLRYVTLALFTNATQVLHRIKLGLDYCHPC